jgi:hypothetical protein
MVAVIYSTLRVGGGGAAAAVEKMTTAWIGYMASEIARQSVEFVRKSAGRALLRMAAITRDPAAHSAWARPPGRGFPVHALPGHGPPSPGTGRTIAHDRRRHDIRPDPWW